MSSDLKSILIDIQNESNGDLLSEEAEIRGKKYLFRLLNDKENSWTVSFFRADNEFSLTFSARLAQLAVGIRAIDGVTIEKLFEDSLDEKSLLTVPEKDSEESFKILMKNEEINKKNENLRRLMLKYDGDRKLIAAYFFKEFLSNLSSNIIEDLYKVWQDLSNRQMKAQSELKNLSGESLETDEKKSLTELSQNGEQ